MKLLLHYYKNAAPRAPQTLAAELRGLDLSFPSDTIDGGRIGYWAAPRIPPADLAQALRRSGARGYGLLISDHQDFRDPSAMQHSFLFEEGKPWDALAESTTTMLRAEAVQALADRYRLIMDAVGVPYLPLNLGVCQVLDPAFSDAPLLEGILGAGA